MKAIFKRELRTLLCGLRGWGYAAVVLLGAAISITINNIMTGAPRFELNLYSIALSMAPATALASADAFHADRRQNTERLLFSLPLKNSSIMLGKLLAHLVPVAIAGAALCIFPLALSLFGPVALGTSLIGIAALAVLGAAMMSIGVCLSACTPNRYAAFFATLIILLCSWAAPYAADYLAAITEVTIPMMLAFMAVAFCAVYMMSSNAFAGVVAAAAIEVPALLASLQGTGEAFMDRLGACVNELCIFSAVNSFVNGLLDGAALIEWAAILILFAFVTLLSMNGRRQAKRRAL